MKTEPIAPGLCSSSAACSLLQIAEVQVDLEDVMIRTANISQQCVLRGRKENLICNL